MHGPDYLRLVFDVAQVDGVVEQEHQPVQGVAGQAADAGLAGEEQRAAPGPDQADEAAHIGGEAVLPGIAVGRQVPVEAGGHAGQLGTGGLEGDVQAVFSPVHCLDQPAEAEDRLADAGGTGDETGVALARAAAHQVIQAGDTAGDLTGQRGFRIRDQGLDAREHLHPARPDPEGVLARQVAAAAHLDDPQPPPVDRLAGLVLQLDDAVRQREHDVAAQLLGGVLAQQQQHRAGPGEPAGQVIQRAAQLPLVGKVAQHLGAVHHHDRGLLIQRLADDLRYQPLQAVLVRRSKEVAHMDVLDR